MSGAKRAKKKQSFGETLRAASSLVSAALQLRQAVQGAFHPGPGSGSCLWRGQFPFPAGDCPGDKHDFPRRRSQSDGRAL